MKTVKSEDALRTMALRTGAELVLGGERFNTLRAVVVPPPPPPKPTPAPLPEYLTREQVEQVLAAHEARMFQRLEKLLAGMKAPQTNEWVHQVTYDRDGAVTAVRSIRK